MRLNNAIIDNRIIDNDEITYQSTPMFIEALKHTKNIVADVYVNNHKLFTCKLVFIENNGHLIACADEQFSLSESTVVDSIQIRVHQATSDVNIMSSNTTNVDSIIDIGDCDADLYFHVLSTTPNSTSRDFTPESKFVPLHTNKITPISLASQPGPNSDIVSTES